jgi:hypothetical protein
MTAWLPFQTSATSVLASGLRESAARVPAFPGLLARLSLVTGLRQPSTPTGPAPGHTPSTAPSGPPGADPGPRLRHRGYKHWPTTRLRDRSAIALRCTCRHLRLSRSPLPCLRSHRCSRDLAATLRSLFLSKMSQGTKCPLPGSRCHAAIGTRIVLRLWWQPQYTTRSLPPRFSAPIPTLGL